jgi:TRAP-type C4-dicarboxylate transport system substrate-binding protein
MIPIRWMPALILALSIVPAAPVSAESGEIVRLKVAGGLGDGRQYRDFEAPFWNQTVPRRSSGRIQATVAPFDRSGIRGNEMLRLMRLGAVPFGIVIPALVESEEPELSGAALPMLHGDLASVRTAVGAFKEHLTVVLRERHDIELLATFVYPGQVAFCTEPLARLDDLKGRRVRVSSVGQGEVAEALGAVTVTVPFARIVEFFRNRSIDCAVTGSMSGYVLGLGEVVRHVHSLPWSWGINVFAANARAWSALPAWARELLLDELSGLEREVWHQAVVETDEGFSCLTGAGVCPQGRPAQMSRTPVLAEDHARRLQIFRESVLPGWIGRCGEVCGATWRRLASGVPGLESMAAAR